MEKENENGTNTDSEYEIITSESMNYDYNFKVIVIGNTEVGKSSLTYRGTKNKFAGTISPTIGYEYFEFNIKIKDSLKKKFSFLQENNDYELPENAKDKTIKLSIWDTCGQEHYRSLVNNFFHSSSMALIVYSIDKTKSFDSINDWVKQVKNFAATNCKLILIGNKTDLNDNERKVTYEQGHKIASENNMSFFIETSAKNGENVKDLFINAAYLLYYEYLQSESQQTIDEGMIKDLINLKPNVKPKKSCC